VLCAECKLPAKQNQSNALLRFFTAYTSACEVKVNTGAADAKEEAPARNKNKIRNGIELTTTGGVQVEQAFLTYVDNGSFVSDSNVTTINRPLKLNLLATGWSGGEKIALDAEQKITTSEGDVVLEQKDMLKEANPIALKDAGYLSFQFVITRLNKLFDYFLVEVSVRNKEANQQILAKFKIHIE
jgi:hypothetical protein